MKYRIKDDPSFSADAMYMSPMQRCWKPLQAFSHRVNREKATFSFGSETISLWKHESFYININHRSCPGVKWMETGLHKVAVLTW